MHQNLKHGPISLAADCIIFKWANENNNDPRLLLIKRKNEPYKNKYALPGGFINPDEAIATGALRELKEETSLVPVEFKQINVFTDPDRDPRGRVISFLHIGRVEDDAEAIAGDDAKEIHWLSEPIVNEIDIAFDHHDMIQFALPQIYCWGLF